MHSIPTSQPNWTGARILIEFSGEFRCAVGAVACESLLACVRVHWCAWLCVCVYAHSNVCVWCWHFGWFDDCVGFVCASQILVNPRANAHLPAFARGVYLWNKSGRHSGIRDPNRAGWHFVQWLQPPTCRSSPNCCWWHFGGKWISMRSVLHSHIHQAPCYATPTNMEQINPDYL